MPFHYMDGANWLTIDALDSISSTPEYKVCAIRVEKLTPEEAEQAAEKARDTLA